MAFGGGGGKCPTPGLDLDQRTARDGRLLVDCELAQLRRGTSAMEFNEAIIGRCVVANTQHKLSMN